MRHAMACLYITRLYLPCPISRFLVFPASHAFVLSFFRVIVPLCSNLRDASIASLLRGMMPIRNQSNLIRNLPYFRRYVTNASADTTEWQLNDHRINHRMTMTFYCTIWFFCLLPNSLKTHYFSRHLNFPKLTGICHVNHRHNNRWDMPRHVSTKLASIYPAQFLVFSFSRLLMPSSYRSFVLSCPCALISETQALRLYWCRPRH